MFEVLLIEIQEEIHHFAGWEGGGLRGAKIVNNNFVNKLALPSLFNAPKFSRLIAIGTMDPRACERSSDF